MSGLRTSMLPPLSTTAVDGNAVNLQAFRHRVPLLLVFIHRMDCPDCLPALDGARAAHERFPEVRAIVAGAFSVTIPDWAEAVITDQERLVRWLWYESPSLPLIVVADKYAAIRRVIRRDFALSLISELGLLDHECPE